MLNGEIILLVEDDSNDVVLLQRAFQKAGLRDSIRIVRDGEQAIHYLSGEGEYSDRDRFPLPFLILLDLKMPGTNGFEVLQWIREQPSLSPLRIVVLTSSDHLRDVNRAYQLGANSFLVKPLDFQNFRSLSKMIEGYWLNTSKAPEVSRPERLEPFKSVTRRPSE